MEGTLVEESVEASVDESGRMSVQVLACMSEHRKAAAPVAASFCGSAEPTASMREPVFGQMMEVAWVEESV